jgi:exopolysaccharide production protein ExoZ
MELPRDAPQRRRLVHLQVLRGVAASLVVVNHTFTTLSFVGMPWPRYDSAAVLTGSMGVAAFFVLSGFLMVRQTAGMFGSLSAALVFAWRRAVRVVPLYWIATLALFLAERHWGWFIPHARGQLLLSLSFLPNYLFSPGLLLPVVAQGWTLDYEMAFYALFALCLLLPPRWGPAVLLAVLLAAFGTGVVHWFPVVPGPAAWLNFYTASVLVLFAAGVGIGLAENGIARLPKLALPFSPALLLLLPAVLLFVLPALAERAAAKPTLWCCGVAVVLLCTLAREAPSGRFERALVRLGDASYSTYLFHLWVMSRTVLRLGRYAPMRALAPWVYVAGCLVAANLLGLLLHWSVERPLTRALHRLRLGTVGSRAQRRMAAPDLGG